MPTKPAPKPDDPEQSKRFVDIARDAETDESAEAFDRAFKKVATAKHITRKSSLQGEP